ncbi:MAG: LPS export ABC transporter permease LptG [Legionellaceae bacterium]|nr:LPS export ABC transporter permease LptG [Legionellaceae bacterium]
MLLIDRYITKTVVSSIVMVICMLTGLQIFILFVNELGDLGRGDYGVLQALTFVLMTMPYQVYLFFPMASLLGCLIGLGIMASNNELVVIRAASMSIGQITLTILKVALVLILIVTVLGESIFPKLVLLANDNKMQSITAGQSLRTSRGTWMRYHNDFIAIENVVPGKKLRVENVHQFHFDSQNNLTFVRHIGHANFINNIWEACDIDQTNINDDSTSVSYKDKIKWDVYINPRMLNMSANEPDEMTFLQLESFLKNQKLTHQTTLNYQLIYWQRIVQPFTTVVMMMLAIPFIFGPLRSSTMGSKLLLGATVGFGFYIANRFFGSLSQIYQFSSIIAAIGPTSLCALLGIYLMGKIR